MLNKILIGLGIVILVGGNLAFANYQSKQLPREVQAYFEAHASEFKGEVGLKGDKGDKGDAGSAGKAGRAGSAGATGTQGARGTTGTAGQDGQHGCTWVDGYGWYCP